MSCWTEDLETAKVGSACLFETLRSGARKILRFLDIADNDDDSAYNTDCQPDSDNDSAYYTDNTCYKPSTSKQKRPRARGAMTVQSHVGSTKPIRKPEND
jgi:hypothetical protein